MKSFWFAISNLVNTKKYWKFCECLSLILLLFYNPTVCFSDLAANIIYCKTDECCPITYSSTWTVIEACLRTLMHCLNKPDGALQYFSRTVTRYCACETAPQVQRELWTIFYASAMDSWRVRIWLSLHLFYTIGVACHVAYCTSNQNQDLCAWESKLSMRALHHLHLQILKRDL